MDKKKEESVRQKRLRQLDSDIRNVKSSLGDLRRKNNKKHVPGEGDPLAKAVIVAEAPGAKEAESGRPLVGPSGKVVNEEILPSIGKSREDFYITNIVKDRPDKNEDPTKKDIQTYAPFLDREIEIIQPKIIITLGNFSTQYILKRYGAEDEAGPITKIRGQFFEVNMPYGKALVFPLFHPAYTIRNRSKREILLADFAKLKKYLK